VTKTTCTCDGCGVVMPPPDCQVGFAEQSRSVMVYYDLCQGCMDRVVAIFSEETRLRLRDRRVIVHYPRTKGPA
jgi:hypothetical protein